MKFMYRLVYVRNLNYISIYYRKEFLCNFYENACIIYIKLLKYLFLRYFFFFD